LKLTLDKTGRTVLPKPFSQVRQERDEENLKIVEEDHAWEVEIILGRLAL